MGKKKNDTQKTNALYHRIFSVRGSSLPPPSALDATIFSINNMPPPFFDTPQFKTTLAILRERLGDSVEDATFTDLVTIIHALEIDLMVQNAKSDQVNEFTRLKLATDTAVIFFNNPKNQMEENVTISLNQNEQGEWSADIKNQGEDAYSFTREHVFVALEIIHGFEDFITLLAELAAIAEKMASGKKIGAEKKDLILQFVTAQRNRFHREDTELFPEKQKNALKNSKIFNTLFEKIIRYPPVYLVEETLQPNELPIMDKPLRRHQ